MIDSRLTCGHISTMNKTETTNVFSAAEKLARLRLVRTEGIGPVTFRELLDRFGDGAAAMEGAIELASRNRRKNPFKPASLDACERELEELLASNVRVYFLGERDYPWRLAATNDAPPILFTRGNSALFGTRTLGVVGARNASAAGLKLTRSVVSALSKAGVTIASGLARGIDTAAHQAALEGGTIACVAGGLDVFYPRENEALQRSIGDGGLLVSEMPLGTKPQARHFPRRNRLISGLSDGVLIVEAAVRSGSLITARYAADQGREVFAVPGSPLDPRARGGNRLIKDGATLVENAEELLAELPGLPAAPLVHSVPQKSQPQTRAVTPSLARTNPTPAPRTQDNNNGDILSLLGASPIHTDEIVRLSGETTEDVLARCLELELAGKITRHPGGRVSRNYE